MDILAHQGSSSSLKFSQKYKIGGTLGKGAFSEVKFAKHIPTGLEVAVKIMSRSKIRRLEMEEKVRREITIMRLFVHPHIIRLYEVIETRTKIYLVMEYAKSGDLFDYILMKGRIQEDEARKLFQQTIAGVEYCHKNKVVHRDLKAENLLLDSNHNVKIADFGLCNIMRDGHFLKTRCGSPDYMAPEIISGNFYAGPEVDVWSCGVILYALLCGVLPFAYDGNIPYVLRKIQGGLYHLPKTLSSGARDLISRMLVVDPIKRITIPEIRQHPWFHVHLPIHLAVPPPSSVEQANMIDVEIFRKVVRMGFDKNHLFQSLCKKIQNDATVSYYVLMDNKVHLFDSYLAGPSEENIVHLHDGLRPNELPSPVVGNHITGSSDSETASLNLQYPMGRRWFPGLQFQADPGQIMTEVLKALRELNVCWKKIGLYSTRCRWIPGRPDHRAGLVNEDSVEVIDSTKVVKFEVQLYKTPERKKYLLDMQRLQGPQFLFFDLCVAFLAQLQARNIKYQIKEQYWEIVINLVINK